MSINEQIGTQLVQWFKLKKKKNGRYDTTFGDKTLEGLGASMKRIIEDAEDKARRDSMSDTPIMCPDNCGATLANCCCVTG